MTKYFTLFLTFSALCFHRNVFSQALLSQDPAMFYKESKSFGEYRNGLKYGRWVDQTINGIIYTESWYDTTGNPTGAWKINYPDGTPRRQYEYNRPGIAKWTICRYKHKLAEVSSDLFIPAEIIKSLDEFETNLFDQEKNILTSEHVAGSNGMVLSGTTSFRTDPYQAVIHVEDLMTAGKFSGTVLIWSEELTIRRKCTFINGSEYRISFFPDFDNAPP